MRALVEEHGGGKSLVRVSTHLRPTIFGVVAALGLGAALLVGAATGVALQQPLAGTIVASLTVALIALVAWRTAQTTAIVRRGIARVTVGAGMVGDAVGPGARAADRAVAAAALRPAQRVHLRPDDPGARREHVHAARSGDRRR